MNITKRLVFSLNTGLAMALMLLADHAHAQNYVTTCGQTLNRSGEYQLAKNLNCSSTFANGVTINASNVVLHLASFSISSSDCNLNKDINGIFVGGGLTGVRIDGGTVKGFNDGIVLSSSNSSIAGTAVQGAC